MDETGDIDLGAYEVSDGSAVVVQRGREEEIHEGRAVAAIVEDGLANLLARFDRGAQSGNGWSVCLGSLQEAAVSTQDIIS